MESKPARQRRSISSSMVSMSALGYACRAARLPTSRPSYPFARSFAQVSLSVSVRLNTSAPGRESASGVK